MKVTSFDEILKEKILAQTAAEAASPERETPISKLRFEFTEPVFFISPDKIKQSGLKRSPYPHKPRKTPPVETVIETPKVVAPPPPPVEKWILKANLDADGISKWNLFEKTTGLKFGEKITKTAARSAFRKFLKSVHPDLNSDNKSYNFAMLVKVRDEFMKVLDSQTVTNA